jgi:osmotically-inducible protein OsmY
MKTTLLLIAISPLLLLSACDRNDTANTGVNNNRPDTAPATSSLRPDNTGVNKVDRDANTQTPIDQNENKNDVRITADIRRAVLDEKNLSTNAHNSKIITANGAVTLRGVVDSEAEKTLVESKAKAVAGVVSVDNQLQIKNP